MRLFGLIDGAINRHDRPFFFGLPFNGAYSMPVIGSLLIDGVFFGDGLTVERIDTRRLLVNDIAVTPNRLEVDFVGTMP